MPAPSPLHASSPLPTWEPALSQLRNTAPADLDLLVSAWLTDLDLQTVRLIDRRAQVSTYQARLGTFPASLPVHIRVFQRRNRLQLHHVEAFLGSLARQNAVAGVLVTTGHASQAARHLALEITQPRLRLLTGPEWAKELAARDLGVRQHKLKAWLFALACQPFGLRPRRPAEAA